MTLDYGVRLAFLVPAAFFAIHLVLGFLIRLSALALIRRVCGTSTSTAANLLLTIRLAPAIIAFATVFGLCVPSFLLHEQRTAAEGIGITCLLAALLGLATWGDALVRTLQAVFLSSRFLRRADHARGLVALAGIFRPRLLVSSDVLHTLSPEELQAALRHEQAHWTSRDNLKQLMVLLAPSLLPGWRGFSSLENAWRQFTEWAADDRAVSGNPQMAVALAAALVRVSRLAANPKPVPLAASLLDAREHLQSRVTRLLNGSSATDFRPSRAPLFVMTGAVLTAAIPLLYPRTLVAVHDLLEKLIQ